MDLRRAAPVVFAALCLGLSVLVLHRQISDHPMPLVVSPPNEPPDRKGFLSSSGPVSPTTWRVATEPVRRAALAAIGNQLAALRTGDADGAWFYQSRARRRDFRSGQEFVAMIAREYPEFSHSQSAIFGPVWTDTASNQAAVTVTVRGRNGRFARGYYRLVREETGYKVAGVAAGHAIN